MVTVTVSSDDTGAATVSPSSLTFTGDNWSIPQTITVSPQDDSDSTDESVTIAHAVSGAADHAGAASSFSVSVDDDDVANLELDLSVSSLDLDEVGEDGTYTVQLSGQPTAAVTVAVESDDTGAASVTPAKLTFTTTNWDEAQTVTVSPKNDGDLDDETVEITHAASGSDDYQDKTAELSVGGRG